jgi:replicative DNA helicase
MGKSAIGVQVALNAARAGHGVLYSSLEMPAASLQERIYSSWLWSPDARIEYVDISQGIVGERELRWLKEARNDVDQLPMVIDDRAQLSPSDIEAQARVVASRLQRQGKSLDLLVVDHIHKMIAPPLQKPVEVFSNISARLADLSKKLDCAVLCLAQLNRGVESRENKRPLLSDLRESGAIEQDADVVMFAFRESYYLERHKGKSFEDEADRLAMLSDCQNRLELIIAKNRQGPIGTADLWADMPCNVIRDQHDYQNMEARAA